MATRRRRTTQPAAPAPVEPTHEEMLEVAAEREEEQAIEVFMAMAAADTFEVMYKAEEEEGLEDFFDPDFYKQPQAEVRPPAQGTGAVLEPPAPKPLLTLTQPRYLARQSRTSKYRKD